MRAIILAAGMGTRLRRRQQRPKCLLRLHGQTMIDFQLQLLHREGIDDISIITGFEAHQVEDHVANRARTYFYPHFGSTNNLLTLHAHCGLLDGPVMILFADVLVSPSAFQRLARTKEDLCLLIDTRRCVSGTMRVRLRGNEICDIGSHIDVRDGDGNFLGLAAFSRRGTRLIREGLETLSRHESNRQAYYVAVVRALAEGGQRIQSLRLEGSEQWLEVDTPADYETAQSATFYLLAKHPVDSEQILAD